MSLASSLERKLKAAVAALANGGSPKPVNVIRNGGDTPVPEPEKGSYMGAVTGEVGKISATRGKGGDPYPVNLTIYNSSQVEVASGSFTAEDVAPLEVVDADIVAGTYTVHVVWLGAKEGEPQWFYDDKEVTVEAALPAQDPLPSSLFAINNGTVKQVNVVGMENAEVSVSYNGSEIAHGVIDTPQGDDFSALIKDIENLPEAGETITVTVTKSGYADWTGTVTVVNGQ